MGCVLSNPADDEFHVWQRDSIAQSILEKVATPVVEEVQELDSTSCGASGFGNTGIQSNAIGGCMDSSGAINAVLFPQPKLKSQEPIGTNSLKWLDASRKTHILS